MAFLASTASRFYAKIYVVREPANRSTFAVRLILKITIVLGPYFPVPTVLGGAVERVHLALAEEFARRGHKVTMISRRFADWPHDEMRSGVRHLRVDSIDAPISPIKFRLHDLLYSLRVRKVLPDSEITVTNSFFLPLVLRKSQAHHLYVHVARYPKWQMWLYLRADRIQAISPDVAYAIRRQTPVLASKLITIPYPLSGIFASSPSIASLDRRQKIILYVGRLHREKGIHLLIDAFKRLAGRELAGYRLEIVGPHEVRAGGGGPDYLQELRQLSSELGDRIIFRGAIFDPGELRETYDAADLFVYPSIAELGEAFGLAPLEAMAAGCRVVVSDLNCFRAFLENGRNGVSFDHRHNAVESLAVALAAVVADPEPKRMRKAAVETATRFQIGPIADRFIDDFQQILNRKQITGLSMI